MTVTQIEYFAEVARTMSYSKASENLYVSRQTLGKQIQALEKELLQKNNEAIWGFLRASHRDLDKLATDFQPIHSHEKEERLKPGEIIPVDIEIYPHSRIWHKGEYIVVQLAGKYIKTEWFHDAAMNHLTDNGEGMHVIHTGGKYDSYLQIPVIPPKYQVGDYIYRG